MISSNSILVTIGVVVVVIVIGIVLSPTNTMQVVGFGTIICVALLGILQQMNVATKVAKVETTLAQTNSTHNEKLDTIHDAVNGNNKKLEDNIESLRGQLTE